MDGERVRYFQDDDNMGLKEMVRREKMSSAQDQNALYSRMAAKVRGNRQAVPGGFLLGNFMHLYSSFVCIFVLHGTVTSATGVHCRLTRVFRQLLQVEKKKQTLR